MSIAMAIPNMYIINGYGEVARDLCRRKESPGVGVSLLALWA